MSQSQPELIEDFFGVYLLYCVNPRYKGRTYIGYTRDPNRRILQHNRGSHAGGAHRTSKRGPWKMVLIVHGFPNNISALRFEWAWQNPNKTIRLQHLNLKKLPRKESVFQFKLRVLSEMLRVGPWCRLPLTIRWLEQEYFEDIPEERKPPDHMKICHGPVKSRNLKKKTVTTNPVIECLLCSSYITNLNILKCINKNCELVCHLTCLAELFLTPGEYVPIGGSCPFCCEYLKWGDLIRKMKGCGEKDLNNAEVEENQLDESQTYEYESESSENRSELDELRSESDENCSDLSEKCSQKDDNSKKCTKRDNIYDNPSWMYDCDDY